MIGYLRGKIFQINKDRLILDVSGVGYEVFCSTRTLSTCNDEDQLELFVYTHVREDQLKLFGFETILEKEMFEAIISVSGVGPKIGLLILSAGKVDEIKRAISMADVNFFTKIKGLGKKGAQKIIIELKNKLGNIKDLDLNNENEVIDSEIMEALISFGFRRSDILPVLAKIDQSLATEEQLKIALRMLGK